MESKQKNILIGVLLSVVFVMAVGYAAFAQQLNIGGTAEITSTWDIKIESISAVASGTGADHTDASQVLGKDENNQDITWNTVTGIASDKHSATLAAILVSPTDSVTYSITVKNYGTIDAKLSDAGVSLTDRDTKWWTKSVSEATATDDAILFTVEDTSNVEKLPAGQSKTFKVVVTYNPAITTQPADEQLTKSVDLTLNYIQDAGA